MSSNNSNKKDDNMATPKIPALSDLTLDDMHFVLRTWDIPYRSNDSKETLNDNIETYLSLKGLSVSTYDFSEMLDTNTRNKNERVDRNFLNLNPPQSYMQTPNAQTYEFSTWLKLFDNYLDASGLVHISDKRKMAIFLNTVGAEAHRIYYSLKLSCETYEELKEVFLKQFEKRRTLIFYRVQFRKRKQAVTETLQCFISSLHSLVANCKYDEN